MMLRIGSLFAGIGGFDLGFEQVGLGHPVFQVEKDEFCNKVLARHWPHVPRFDDVCSVGAHNLPPCDILCGGFPCQDLSTGNPKGDGLLGARSGLWREYSRIVRELRPDWVVVENAGHTAGRWLPTVLRELQGEGYGTIPAKLEARYVGAPHRRGRVFVVAHSDAQAIRDIAERMSGRRPGEIRGSREGVPVDDGEGCWWLTLPSIHRSDDGLSRGMDGRRIAALGNAVVPQVAAVVGQTILELRALIGAKENA